MMILSYLFIGFSFGKFSNATSKRVKRWILFKRATHFSDLRNYNLEGCFYVNIYFSLLKSTK
jgi:hypothetical protein